jgi:hypothetical protein
MKSSSVVALCINFQVHKIVLTAIINDKVTVISANQYELISLGNSIEIVANIIRNYGYYPYSQNIKVYVDSSRPDWVRDLKSAGG